MKRTDVPKVASTFPTNDEGQVTIEDAGTIRLPDGTGLYFVVTDGVVEVAEPGEDYMLANPEELDEVFRVLNGRIDKSIEALSIQNGKLYLLEGENPAVRPSINPPLPVGPGASVRRGVAAVVGEDGAAESVTGEVLTVEAQEYRKERLLSDLRRAADAEAKMDILAAFLDRYGFDAFIGLIPHVGDGAVTALAGLFTFWQGMKAGIGIKSGAKIAGFHLADFLVGQIPVLGEVADLFMKPNEFAAGEVAHRLRVLLDEARAKGVSEEEIQEVLRGGKEFKETWYGRMQVLRKVKKALGFKDKHQLEDHGGHDSSSTKDPGHGTHKPPETKVLADFELPVLAADLLLYQDILRDLDPTSALAASLKRAGDRVRWGGMNENEQNYARALKELLGQDTEKVFEISDRCRATFNSLMNCYGFTTFNPFSLSQSWSLWDIAKQHHHNKYERTKSPGYHLGDPLTDGKVQEDIFLRHFGWELYQKWQDPREKGKIEAKISSSPDRNEIEALFAKTPNGKGTLSSKDLARLGELCARVA